MSGWIAPALFVACAFCVFFVVRLVRLMWDSSQRKGGFLFPFEARLLQWLQDRASARALGVDVGIIRARRKIDFPDH